DQVGVLGGLLGVPYDVSVLRWDGRALTPVPWWHATPLTIPGVSSEKVLMRHGVVARVSVTTQEPEAQPPDGVGHAASRLGRSYRPAPPTARPEAGPGLAPPTRPPCRRRLPPPLPLGPPRACPPRRPVGV